MKRIYSFMFAAVAAFAAASCAQELDNQLPEGEKVVFEASVDGADTKVTLDGKVSKWESGDKITIHNGTKGYEFSTTDEGVKAEFSYVGDDFSGDKFLAVYPAGEYTADVENKTVTANIPTYQPSRENDFSVGAVPSVAYAENNSLAFKNASALLKFTVKGTNVKGLVFYGNNNEAVSGNIKVSLDEDNAVESVEALETTITENDVTETKLITWAKVWAQTDDYCFNEGVTYYLSVVPQNFEKGFTAQLEVDGVGTVDVKKLETGYDLKPNTILDLGELEYKAPSYENLDWGIAGTMTDWADGKDIAMEREGDWFVARNITLDATASFKFRAGGSWDTNRGTDGTPVEAGVEVALTANGQDIKVAAPAIYDVYFAITADKMKLEKVGDVEIQEPEVANWGIVGTLTSWGSNINMDVVDGWYVARNITITTEDGFKFRNGDSWADDDLLTYDVAPIEAGVEYNTICGAGQDNEIKVAVSAIYDVYLSIDLAKFKLEKVGDVEVDEPSDEPVASDWGIVGDLTNWAANKDITMYSYKGMYVAYNVNFATAGGFKVRKGGVWNDAYNYGLESSGNVTAGHYYSVITSGGSGNLMVTAGTYDIWFDLAGKKVYVLEPGADPATATKGTAVAPLTNTWYLVGDFNGWKPADATYKMTGEGTWYVFKNFKISSGKVKFVADANWTVNRGGSWTGKDKKVTLDQGGADIAVAAGTYDVYLSSDAKYAYFMTPGSVPAN